MYRYTIIKEALLHIEKRSKISYFSNETRRTCSTYILMEIRDSFNDQAEALQKGDIRSAEKIFDHFSGPIYAFFMARIRHKESAQDLTQEVFLKVIKSIDQFDRKSGNFTSWIWQIARNSAIDHFRHKKPSYLADLPDEGSNINEEGMESDQSAKTREIMTIVESFSSEDQELFQLHFIADLSYSEIAKVTGKSPTSLRVAIHRLRKKIIPYLND